MQSSRAIMTDSLKALRISENRYCRLFETAQDGILLLNADTSQIEDVNPYLIEMLGYTHAEFLGKKLWEVGPFADIAQSKEMFADLKTKGHVRYEDLPLKTKAGARIQVEFVSNTYDCEDIRVIQCNIRNITERKVVEAHLRRHTQLYAALSQCNHAIVHCTSEEELFQKVCYAAVQFGDMKMAWVGLIDPVTRMVVPAASFGEGIEYLQNIEISVDADSPFGSGPTGTAIRENRPFWCQDFFNDPSTVPWRERVTHTSLAASASLPLYKEGIVVGAFSLYASEINVFDEAERELLIEMATNVSFTLDNFYHEVQRKRVQGEIEFKNTILQTQQETSLDAILVVDENEHIISYNQQFIDLWQLPPQLLSAGQNPPVLKSGAELLKNPEEFLSKVGYLVTHKTEKSRDELQFKDGRIIDRYSAPVIGAEGKHYGRVWYFRDITERKLMEESIKASQTLFSTIFKQSPLGIALIDSFTGQIYEVNFRFAEITGRTIEELTTIDWMSITYPDDVQEDLDNMALMNAGKTPGFKMDKRYIRPDGSLVWVDMTIASLKGKDISPRHLCMIDDITERKLTESRLKESEAKFRLLFERSMDGILLLDDNRFIECNPATLTMMGYNSQKQLRSTPPWLISPPLQPDGRSSEEKALEMIDIARTQGRHRFEWVHRRMNGEDFPVEVTLIPLKFAGSDVIYVTWRDISDRKRNEQELRIASIAFEAQEGIVVSDAHKVILRVNQAFTHLTGYTAEEAIGQRASLLKSGHHDDLFYRDIWEALTRDYHWHGEIWNRRKNGEVHPDWLTISAVTNADGQVTNYVSTYSDLTQYKKDEAKIYSLAFYDTLTGLPNRSLLVDRLQHAFAVSARHLNHGALLFIDLDNFKTLNDTRGHNIGDLLLIEVANRLQACVREVDTVARLGGDEFVVLLEYLGEGGAQASAQAEAVGEKILAAINQPYALEDYEYHSSASIGISPFGKQEITVDELLKRADAAMYQAKGAGRNTLRFYDPAMQEALEVRTALESDLRVALAENQFRLYYQMQVYHSGHIIAAEVLLRWQHPQHGLVSPLQFIALAEETGLILPIGQWVLDTACAQLKAWERDINTRHLRLGVNVSARQFHQADFVDQVRETILRNKIDPDMLDLELTESLVLDDIDDTIVKMHALRETGVHFSMDDFGTGYSSLSYLTKLPFDQLKIDQSFVRNIGVKQSDAVIVQTIIGMANNLGMEVIAEGVETEEQRAFLQLHGCPVCQGYLFSRPLLLEEFEARLKCA